MATLTGVIETSHGVTTEQILEARKHRDWRFDWATLMLFAGFYSLVAIWICRSLARRFRHVDGKAWFPALLLTSVAMSLVAMPLFELWAMTAEMVRLGNDHLGGHRATLYPWSQHIGERFVAGVLIVWLVGSLRQRITRHNEQTSLDVGGPHGVLVR